MAAQSRPPPADPRVRAAAKFTTGALFKRWSVHFAVAISIAAVAYLNQRHPWLAGDERDLSPEQLLSEINCVFALGGGARV